MWTEKRSKGKQAGENEQKKKHKTSAVQHPPVVVDEIALPRVGEDQGGH